MFFFVEHDDDPGFEVGQGVCLNDAHWRIIGVRDNGRGVWLTLRRV